MSEIVRLGRGRRLDSWRAGRREAQADAARHTDHLVTLWSAFLLIVMLLYVLIGHQPWNHEAVIDPATGAAPVSPFNRFIWLIFLAGSMPILWFKKAELPDLVRRQWPLIVLFGWFVASSLWALDPDASRRRVFLYAVNLIVCFALVLGLRKDGRLHAAMAIACAILVFIDLGSWIVAPAASMTPLGLAAIHTHKNTLGAAMLLSGMVTAPYAFSRPTPGGRIFWSAILLGSMVLLAASLSKTSMALLAVALALMPLVVMLMRARAMIIGSTLFMLAALVATVIFGWVAWSYAMGADPVEPLTHITFTSRTDVWKFSISQALTHPWRGLGFGSFWDIDPAIQPDLKTDLWFAKPDAYTNESHNGYIDLWVTTGLVGLVGALFMLARWTVRAFALLRQALLAEPTQRVRVGYLIYVTVFPLIFFIHNWMESSYFTANSIYGTIILLVGMDIDQRFSGFRRPQAA